MRRALLLVAACLVLAACAGGGSHRLSREDYAKQADAICTRFNRQQPALPSLQNVTAKQIARLAGRTLPLLGRTIRELRRLAPSKDEQDVADRWLVALRRLRVDAVRIRNRARANDLGGVAALIAPSQRDERTAERLAARLGTHVCSKPS